MVRHSFFQLINKWFLWKVALFFWGTNSKHQLKEKKNLYQTVAANYIIVCEPIIQDTAAFLKSAVSSIIFHVQKMLNMHYFQLNR